MKTLRTFLSLVVLLSALSMPAFADGTMETPPAPTTNGTMETPPAPAPPPDTTQTTTADGTMETPPVTVVIQTVLNIVLGLF